MSISFTVPGKTPSKSNFRWSAKDPKARQKWATLKQYEQLVGLSALAAGCKKNHVWELGRADVKITLVSQRLDVDNAAKVFLDGLRGVAFVDDSPKYVRSVTVAYSDELGAPEVYCRISWEDAQ